MDIREAVISEVRKKLQIRKKYDAWIRGMQKHPILGDEYRRMQQLYNVIAGAVSSLPETQVFSESYQSVYGPSRYGWEVLFRRFGQLKAQLATEERAIGNSLLLPVQFRLQPNSQVAATTNPLALLRMAMAPFNSDVLVLRGQIEAVTQFILTRLMLAIDEAESEVDSGETMRYALNWMVEKFFVPDKSGTLYYAAVLNGLRRPAAIHTSLEGFPNIDGSNVHYGAPPVRYVLCDYLTLPVMLDDRIKTDFMSVLKMVRKGVWAREQYDKHGMTLTVEHVEDADQLARGILWMLHTHSCDVVEAVIDQVPGKPIDPNNPDTDPDFRARRLVFRLPPCKLGVIMVEVNIQCLEEQLVATISHSKANHDLYTVHRYHATHFPWRFPQFVYGVDWRQKPKSSKDWQRIAAWIRLRQEWKQ
jgi:hypothetical protein